MESDAESLVLANQRLIGFFCKRQPPPQWMSMDEYSGEMLIALWGSARRYDPERGASFSTYAIQAMRLCAQALQRRHATIRERLLGRSIYLPDGSPMAVHGPQVRCGAFDSVDRHLVGVLTKNLTDQHRLIVNYRMDGLSFREIAALTGVKSHQVVTCRYRAALRVMRLTARKTGITAQSVGL